MTRELEIVVGKKYRQLSDMEDPIITVTRIDGDQIYHTHEGSGYEGKTGSGDIISLHGKIPNPLTIADRFVLVEDDEQTLICHLFDSKDAAKKWVAEHQKDPILCKLVPVCKIQMKPMTTPYKKK